MNRVPGTELMMPRRFAIRLLHEAQISGAQGFLAAVGAGIDPDCFFVADDAGDIAALLNTADTRFAAQSRRLWAVFLHRPDLSAVPAVDDFALRPELLRLTASLATKGVLQLRAWVLESGAVVERTLRIED